MRDSRRLVWLPLVLFFALAPMGGATNTSPPVAAREWKAVDSDWFSDRGRSSRHSCAAIVVARSHIDREKHPQLARDLSRLADLRCVRDGDPWAVVRGMSNREVATRAGAPVPWMSGPKCWYYNTWKPNADTNVVGRTICFDERGYAATFTRALHL
jgi:hypothetical protein